MMYLKAMVRNGVIVVTVAIVIIHNSYLHKLQELIRTYAIHTITLTVILCLQIWKFGIMRSDFYFYFFIKHLFCCCLVVVLLSCCCVVVLLSCCCVVWEKEKFKAEEKKKLQGEDNPTPRRYSVKPGWRQKIKTQVSKAIAVVKEYRSSIHSN